MHRLGRVEDPKILAVCVRAGINARTAMEFSEVISLRFGRAHMDFYKSKPKLIFYKLHPAGLLKIMNLFPQKLLGTFGYRS
jgi:hypothetical protein